MAEPDPAAPVSASTTSQSDDGTAGDANASRRRLWLKRAATASYYLLFAAALALVYRYISQNLDIVDELRGFSATFWLVAVSLYLATLILKAVSFDILAAVFGARIPIKTSVALAASGLLGNYLLPGNTSIPLRSLYLKKMHGLEYKMFVPIALAAFVFATGLYGVATGIASLTVEPVVLGSYRNLISLFAAGGAALIVLLLIPLPVERLPYVGTLVGTALKGWRQLTSNRRLFGLWLLNEVARGTLEVCFFFYTARELGVPISFAQAMIITLVKECSIFLRLTPGAFGVAEGVQAYFAYAFGLDVARIVLAGVVGRFIEILCLLLVSVLLARHLKNEINSQRSSQRVG